MVFIPVAAIILIVWFVCRLVDASIMGGIRADAADYRSAIDKIRQYTDSELERELDYKLKHREIDPRETVRRFMGGDPVWATYTDGVDTDLKVKLVLMAEQGKIPWPFTLGTPLDLPGRAMQGPEPNRVPPDRLFSMNEEFVLRAERFLREEKNVPVAVFCRVDLPDGRKSVFIRLRDLQGRYGPGHTNAITSFQFLHDSYRR